MAMSAWLALAGACLFYVALGLWAVSQIFPTGRATLTGSGPDQQLTFRTSAG